MKLRMDTKKIYALALVLVLLTPLYMVFFESVAGINRLTTRLMFMGVIVFLLVIVVLEKKQINSLNKRIGMIVLSLCAIFCLSWLNLRLVDYSLLQFGFYVLVPAYIVGQDFDFESTLRYCIVLSIPFVLGVHSMLLPQYAGINQADMYVTYAFVPTIIATISHLVHYRSESSFVVKIGYILGLFYLTKVVPVAVRGFILVVLVYVTLEIMNRVKNDFALNNYYVFLIIIVIVLIVVIANFGWFLGVFLDVIKKYLHVQVGFVLKFVVVLKDGDFSNGRLSIYATSLKCFLENPLLGHGIDGIKVWSDGIINYPHNSILQLLVDGGIIFGSLPIITIIKSLYRIVINRIRDDETIIFAVYLTSIGVVNSLLSGDIWKNAPFWIAVFFYAKYLCGNNDKG